MEEEEGSYSGARRRRRFYCRGRTRRKRSRQASVCRVCWPLERTLLGESCSGACSKRALYADTVIIAVTSKCTINLESKAPFVITPLSGNGMMPAKINRKPHSLSLSVSLHPPPHPPPFSLFFPLLRYNPSQALVEGIYIHIIYIYIYIYIYSDPICDKLGLKCSKVGLNCRRRIGLKGAPRLIPPGSIVVPAAFDIK